MRRGEWYFTPSGILLVTNSGARIGIVDGKQEAVEVAGAEMEAVHDAGLQNNSTLVEADALHVTTMDTASVDTSDGLSNTEMEIRPRFLALADFET